ncbi:MAG: DNA polymerase [bacterium]
MVKTLNIKSDIFLIDSSSYFYRAFYALPPLVNSKGFPTGAVLGYTRMLIKLKTKFNIKYGACLFDSRKSFRKEAYKEYKANRIEMPEDLVKQVDYITLISNLLGFKTFKLEGYEADDLIALISEKFSKSSKTICIVTSDKDLKQLLSPNVCIYDAQKDIVITQEIFENEYGIKSEEFKYILALMGDASDNIPGIKGIGEKTALSLIKSYGSLDGIYSSLDSIKQSKMKELLISHKEDAYNSLELASFYKDLPFEKSYFIPQILLNTAENSDVNSDFNPENSQNLNLDLDRSSNFHNNLYKISFIYKENKKFENLEDFALERQNDGELYKIFKEFEFHSLIKNLKLDNAEYLNNNTAGINADSNIQRSYKDYKDEDKKDADKSKLSGNSENKYDYAELPAPGEDELSIYIDYADSANNTVKNIKSLKSENNDNGGLFDSIAKMQDDVHLFSKKDGYICVKLEDFLKNEHIIAELADATIKKIGCDINSIRRYLKFYGVELNNRFFDIGIASYLLNPIIHNHTFNDLYNEFSGKFGELSRIIPNNKENTDDSNISIKSEEYNVNKYSGNKAFLSYFIYRCQLKELEKENELKKIFFEIDMPLTIILADIEEAGFMADKDKLFALSAEFELEAQKMAAIIYKIAGKEFNINSPKQLSEIMFDGLKFKRIKKNSTDIEVLLKLKNEIETLSLLMNYKNSDSDNDDNYKEYDIYKNYLLFLDSIISYRNKIKLKTSFTDVLLKKLDKNSRIHTSFSQIKTSTGRLSSQDPNLQNIPISGIEGKKIRQAFIAPPAKLLICADYSQIDLRVMASISKDSSLIESFRNNEDIHLKTALEIFGIEPSKIDADLRRRAKVINFGIIYGMSPYGLSKELNITQEEAKTYINSFFAKHYAIKDYMKNIVQEAKNNGYVKTSIGRRCYIKDINSPIKNISSFAERAAINAPIQGTAADIIKIAMINIDGELKKRRLKTGMILQIHDELIFEAEINEVELIESIIIAKMTDKSLLSDVPLTVNIGKGKNWDEAH